MKKMNFIFEMGHPDVSLLFVMGNEKSISNSPFWVAGKSIQILEINSIEIVIQKV